MENREREQERLREQIFLRATGKMPFAPRDGFGDEFNRVHREIQQSRRDMGRQSRLFAWVMLLWTLCGVAFIGFLCWCVYHVLKAKGLVP